MAENNYNEYDAYVVVEPTIKALMVPKPITAEVDLGNDASNTPVQHNVMIQGVRIPIVLVDAKVIDSTEIIHMEISYSGFLSRLTLTISDYGGKLQNTNIPGMNNVITIKTISPIDGYYRGIGTNFYITDIDYSDNEITYTAVQKIPELEKTYLRQWGEGDINVYEMLKLIASETGLGFAATAGCEELNDKVPRMMYSQVLKKYIEQQVVRAGGDENNVLDVFVNLQGYIVLVNVKRVFEANVDPETLMIYAVGGSSDMQPTTNDAANQSVMLVPRTITNAEHGVGASNMLVNKFEDIVDNSAILSNGALSNYYIMVDPCVTNCVTLQQTQIIENSIDGLNGSQEYEYERIEFLGVDQSDDGGNAMFQTQIHNTYLCKLRSKQIEAQMKTPNYGLERGTLVNVVYTTNNMHTKRMLATTDSDVAGDDTIIADKTTDMVNPYKSDIYYIDAIRYEYSINNQEIVQYLYLIKKGAQLNKDNKLDGDE